MVLDVQKAIMPPWEPPIANSDIIDSSTNSMGKLSSLDLWDKKAISEKKDLILIRSMQNYINKNL